MDDARCIKHGEALSSLETKVNILERSVMKIVDAQVDMVQSVATIQEVTTTLKDVTSELKGNISEAHIQMKESIQSNKKDTDSKIDAVKIISYKAYNGVWLICSVSTASAVLLSLVFSYLKYVK